MAADCKSAGFSLRWFKSNPLHHHSASSKMRTLLKSFNEKPPKIKPPKIKPPKNKTPENALAFEGFITAFKLIG
jgi:hypothetical protein